MSEKNKKYFQIGYHIVLILLATVFVAVTLLPMVTIDANQSEYPEVYYEGRFTQGMKPIGEIDIGYGTVLDLVTNWSDFITVVGIQADEILKLGYKLDKSCNDIKITTKGNYVCLNISK